MYIYRETHTHTAQLDNLDWVFKQRKAKEKRRSRRKRMEKYDVVKHLGAGNFGVARLLRHKETKELVAMKYIERGHKVYTYIFLINSFN